MILSTFMSRKLSSDVCIGFTAKYFMDFLANFGQFTVYNAGSDNSITAFVFKASLADLCNSPLKNGITSTAAKRTKKKTWKAKNLILILIVIRLFFDREFHSYGPRKLFDRYVENLQNSFLNVVKSAKINLCPMTDHNKSLNFKYGASCGHKLFIILCDCK